MFNEESNIKQSMDKLDVVSIQYEAKWGIGNLIDYANSELKEKWAKQNDKLDSAVVARNEQMVSELVDGSIKGWDALEKNAIALGHKPTEAEYWEVRLDSGFHLRICKTGIDARKSVADGVYVWSLSEVARVLEKDYTLINQIKDVFPEATVTEVQEPFDFKKGDNVGI